MSSFLWADRALLRRSRLCVMQGMLWHYPMWCWKDFPTFADKCSQAASLHGRYFSASPFQPRACLGSFRSHWMVIDAAAFLLFLGHAILLQNADCLPAPLCVALILCAAALPLLVCPEAHSQVVLVVIDGALWSWLSTHTHTHTCACGRNLAQIQEWGCSERLLFKWVLFLSLSFSQSRTFYFSLQQSDYIWRTTRWMLFKGFN